MPSTTQLRKADRRDIEKIAAEYISAAEKGHFMWWNFPGEPQMGWSIETGLRSSVELAVEKGKRPSSISTDLRDQISCHMLIYEEDGSAKGFVWLSESDGGLEYIPTGKVCMELYALLIYSEFRGVGIGKRMFTAILERTARIDLLLIRAYSISKAMLHLANKAGFEDIGATQTGPRICLRGDAAKIAQIKTKALRNDQFIATP